MDILRGGLDFHWRTNVATATLSVDLLRVLWACHSYWETEPVPVEDRAVCFSWVEGKYREKFGGHVPPVEAGCSG